jgi:uncharacterized membrane protein
MSGERTVGEYLAALSGELRVGPLRRRRILVEVGHHLKEAAARAPSGGGEQAAIERFGPHEELAAGFNRQWRARTRVAAAATFVGIGVVFFTVQGLMDGLLPPAPWPEDAAPAAVAWQSGVAQACLLVALLLALAALVGRRWAAAAAGIALLGVALAAAFVSHYELERGALVAGSPGGWELAGVFALRAAALAPAALLLAGRLWVPRAFLTP